MSLSRHRNVTAVKALFCPLDGNWPGLCVVYNHAAKQCRIPNFYRDVWFFLNSYFVPTIYTNRVLSGYKNSRSDSDSFTCGVGSLVRPLQNLLCPSSCTARGKSQTYWSQQDFSTDLSQSWDVLPGLWDEGEREKENNDVKPSTWTNLEKESVPKGIAETENKVLLGVFGYRLHDAVFHPDSVLWDAVVVNARSAVGLIKKQRAS